MAIKGSLKEASLPDVIQLLFLGRRTGRLAVADRQNHGSIFFDEGFITHATIVNRRDRLGDMLVKSGRISQEDLDAAVRFQAGSPQRKLGEILVTLGTLRRDEMERHIRLQVEEAVFALFAWHSGTFSFEAGVHPDPEELLCHISPESVLLEGARRVDEWTLIEQKIPSFDLIFAAEHVPDRNLEFTEVQRRLLPLIDGKRDVRLLVEESGLADFDVAQALYGLLTAGLIQRVGTSTPAVVTKAQENQIEEHRNLGVAFYRTGMLDEALREFRRVAELRPSEGAAPFYLGLIALRQGRWEEAVVHCRQAVERGGPRPAALHNLGVALEYAGRLDEAEAVLSDAVVRGREVDRLFLAWGIVALRRGDLAAALARLSRAYEGLDRARPAPLYWALFRAHLGSGDVDRAGAIIAEGLAAHPGHPILRVAQAVLCEGRGEVDRAEQELRDALAEDQSVPQIPKNLGDICYRTGRYEEAESWYQRAIAIDPALGEDVYFKLGNLALKRTDPATARQCWERTVAINPDHQLARANLEALLGVAS